uniref:BZIP domain-containing protein n=1 Tax=Panagrellus redivivus TaxID=6233 RepID=A0A7E4UXH4_PANRE
MDEDRWTSMLQDDGLHDLGSRPESEAAQYVTSGMYQTDIGSDGVSPCPSSMSSPGESNQSTGSSGIYMSEDMMCPPITDFDEAECMAVIDDYDRQNPGDVDGISGEFDYMGHGNGIDNYSNIHTEYYVDDAGSSSPTKYVVLQPARPDQINNTSNVEGCSAYRPVASSLSFNRPLKAIYPVKSSPYSRGTSTGTSSTTSLSDDESKLAIPTLCRTRSKMHDLAVKNRLITDQNPRGQGYIQLSAEEKRTMLQEGYRLPTKLPLSREEEEALKLVRRKIKNKLSAQESRRKRKEYMDTLEQKVHLYYTEAVSLRQRLKQAEAANNALQKQLSALESNGHRSLAL